MSDRYEQPEKGAYRDQWHIVLNRNFANIGDDVDRLFAEKADVDGIGTETLENYAEIGTNELATGTKPWADVLAYGAVGDGTADDTQAFKDAIAAAPFVYVPYTSAGYRITDQLSLDSTVLFSLSTDTTLHVDLSGSTATTALYLTSQSSSWAVPSAVRNIKVRNERRTWDLTDAYSGIEMDAIHEASTHGVEIDGFEYGLHLNSTDGNGVAYGTYDRTRIMDCVEAIRLETCNDGWTNENTFSNVRIDLTPDKRTERDSLSQTVWGVNFINRTTNNINSNKFVSVAVENTTAGVRCTGRYNTFVGLRCEFMAGADDIGVLFDHPASDYAPPRYNFLFGMWGPTSGDGSASRIVARNADGTEANTLLGNKVIARGALFNTGPINLHEAGYRNISVWYDETNRDFVFEGSYTGIVARLDEETGNLQIAGTVEENVNL